MQDIFYKDNAKAGERRRVWASCQIDGYTNMAGGHGFRMDKGQRMRFKVMHKVNDYKRDLDIICVLDAEDVMIFVLNIYLSQIV